MDFPFLPVSSKTALWLFHVKPKFKLGTFHVEHIPWWWLLEPHWHYNVLGITRLGRCESAAAIGIVESKNYILTTQRGDGFNHVIHIKANLHGFSRVVYAHFFLRLFLFRIMRRDLQRFVTQTESHTTVFLTR